MVVTNLVGISMSRRQRLKHDQHFCTIPRLHQSREIKGRAGNESLEILMVVQNRSSS